MKFSWRISPAFDWGLVFCLRFEVSERLENRPPNLAFIAATSHVAVKAVGERTP